LAACLSSDRPIIQTRLVTVGLDRQSTQPVTMWRNVTDVGCVNADDNS
jgi:hypothetical protein